MTINEFCCRTFFYTYEQAAKEWREITRAYLAADDNESKSIFCRHWERRKAMANYSPQKNLPPLVTKTNRI